MVVKYYDGTAPEAQPDPEIVALALQIQEDYTREMADFRINAALEAAWKLVARMNKYIDEKSALDAGKSGEQWRRDCKSGTGDRADGLP